MTRERGSALVIAVLVMAIMTLLGVSLLLMADTENRIAENERMAAQSLYFGEGVAREVKRWFDRPPYSLAGGSNLVRPTVAVIDRTKRIIDLDGAGPQAATPANGTPALPYYKMGFDTSIFDRPYRPDPKDMFLGTADGPDIQIARAQSTTTADFLDDLSERIMPGFPAGAAGVHARIKEIDVYAPPYLDAGGGNWTRYGVATVGVHVQILRNPGANEEVLAERTVTAVFNEAPYANVFGPLHSCDELAWNNAFKVHWGPATASTTADVPAGATYGMPQSIPRDLAPTPKLDFLYDHLDIAASNALKGSLEGASIDDPWFRFFAGSTVPSWNGLNSPQVFPPPHVATTPDQSNKFQNHPSVSCPEYDYRTWKSIAKSGFSDVHYFASVGGGNFSENGSGRVDSFANLTNGKTGLFFFDTADGLPPHDFDSSNVASNLTQDILITDASYGVRGFLYVNARTWGVTGSPGRPNAVFTLPGEPYFDANENGVYDANETWINLRYTNFTNIDSPLMVDANDAIGSAVPLRNPIGPGVVHDAILWGILYLSGQFDASGTPYYDGSVVTFAGTPTGVRTAGTASLFWDPMIKQSWPPWDWNMPRVIITRWETDE